jgi:uncharacterized protein
MRKKQLFFFAVLVISIFPVLLAADVVLPQRTDEFVNDFSGILTATDKSSIGAILKETSESSGTQILVMIINSVEDYAPGYDPESFASGVFNGWKLEEKTGKAMLLLISIKDRKVALELGGAKEELYKNIMQKVVAAKMLPNFKDGDYGRGVFEGARTLSKVISEKNGILDILKEYSPQALWVLIALLIVIVAARNIKKYTGRARDKSSGSEDKNRRYDKNGQDIFGGGASGNW